MQPLLRQVVLRWESHDYEGLMKREISKTKVIDLGGA